MNNIIEENIQYIFKNKCLLNDALHHSSLKHKGVEFERLEFLGDRILGLIIAEFLYQNCQRDHEGDLARKFVGLVNADTCAKIAMSIGINHCIQTANNRILQNNITVLADAMESLIGAVFLDGNLESARNVVLLLWDDLLVDTYADDPKTQLQELTQAKNWGVPQYTVVSKVGSEHAPLFTVEACVAEYLASGKGTSKKLAEKDAAQKLIKIIQGN